MAKKSFTVDEYDTWTSMREYISSLRKSGYKFLGSGAFAAVYGTPSGKTVIKIGEYKTRWGGWDMGIPKQSLTYEDGNRAYIEYIKAIATKQDNPFFPKIKSAQLHHYHPDESKSYVESVYFIVELERLAPANERRMDCEAPEFIFNWHYEDIATVFAGVMSAKMLRYYKEAGQLINRLTRRYESDLHSGNIMFRANKQVVITDPIA